MRLFLVLIFALSALAAGSRSSLQKRRLASFSHGGDESSQVATSRVLQAAPKMKRKTPPADGPQILRDTKKRKEAYVYFNFSPTTHKSLGMFQPTKKDKYRNSRAFKGVRPGKSPLGPKERRLQEMPRSPLDFNEQSQLN
ncbi:hypothetical protein AeMF1_016207 [Aphanomyces euteiches]|nr:hypothetical protein AeMF1_016207 [Aphanomyces euteiches]KAH9180874.1 hypothetical protein AeNC1_017150 [Aphanomyces euteiches]